jgi:LysM repeat protein
MNNQSPFVPQGSLPEQKNKNRTRVKIAVFFVLAVHGIGLMALLMQGCKNPNTDTANTTNSTETNSAPILVATNPIVPPETNNSFVAQPLPVAPPDTNAVPTSPPPGATEYKIAKGDTLSGVAKKFHVPLKSIQEANPGISPTKLRVGQTVHVPAATLAMATGTSGKTASAGAASTTDSASGEHTYSVQAGDTLTRIASKFGTSVKVIRTSNNLHTDRITVGQKLKVPPKASTPAAAGVSSPEPTTLASASTTR